MAGCSDLGRIAEAVCDARWIQADGRASDSKRRDRDEKFCGGADAVWAPVPYGGFGTHCSADRGEGIESGGGGCASAGGGIERILRNRKTRTAGAIFGDLFEACVEGPAVFLVDDFDAAQVSGRFGI